MEPSLGYSEPGFADNRVFPGSFARPPSFPPSGGRAGTGVGEPDSEVRGQDLGPYQGSMGAHLVSAHSGELCPKV